MKHLFQNTLVNGVAFGLLSVGNLVLIPVIVGAYGLTVYGLLVFAKLLLPTGLLSFADLGFKEAIARRVARARHDGEWRAARRAFALSMGIAALGSAAIGAALWFAAPPVARQVVPAGTETGPMLTLLHAAALLMPVLVAGQLCEGVLRGHERFAAIRVFELAAFAVYATGTLAAVWTGQGWASVGLAFLAGGALRALGFASLLALVPAFAAFRAGRGAPLASLREDFGYSLRIMQSKLLDLGSVQLPQLLIGTILGAASLGLFDLLNRIPQFLKSVVGLLNSAVYPAAARSDHRGDAAAVRRLIVSGTAMSLMVVTPIVSAGIVFAEAVMRLWAGPDVAAYWPYHAALYAIPGLVGLIGLSQQAVLSRASALVVLNQIGLARLLVLLPAAAVFLPQLGVEGYVLLYVGIRLASVPVELWVVQREHAVPQSEMWVLVLRSLLALLPGAGLLIGLTAVIGPLDPVLMLVAMLCWCLLGWAVGLFVVLSRSERAFLHRNLLGVLRRAGALSRLERRSAP